MRLLIVSGLSLAASLLSLALLPAHFVTDFYFRERLWVFHIHLKYVVFCVLLVAAILLFLFSRFEVTFRVR
jgi:hypothetical protein